MKNKDKLVIPAIRIKLGDQFYYMTSMKFKEAADRISLVESFYKAKSLNEFLQRELSEKRASKFAEYLQAQPQRFFNSLVVGIYGGQPEWLSASLRSIEDDIDLPIDIDQQLGVLYLTGGETLFAIDGQHRIAGIKEAVKLNGNLTNDDVPLIIVGHDPKKGLARTRRMFTTLNKHAKSVSKYETIALDQDYIPAVVTRRLVEDFPLFKDRISSAKSKNLPSSDKSSITSLVALYDSTVELLEDMINKSSQQEWLDDDVIDKHYKYSTKFWKSMAKYFSPLGQVGKNSTDSELRTNMGGNALFRPIGLNIVVRVILKLSRKNMDIETAIKLVSRVPMDLSGYPWLGIIWNSSKSVMITSQVNQKLVEQMIYYGSGGDLADYKTDETKLLNDIRSVANKDAQDFELTRYNT